MKSLHIIQAPGYEGDKILIIQAFNLDKGILG
jgi:hypothetical protein